MFITTTTTPPLRTVSPRGTPATLPTELPCPDLDLNVDWKGKLEKQETKSLGLQPPPEKMVGVGARGL